ncbi:MAG: Adaptive-response sensory-kinase SasA [Gemmatimonadaceae bacterium]|nr:Adaptive-response sensory-kinase SasA [Gemmatimonadaceae bacterium]
MASQGVTQSGLLVGRGGDEEGDNANQEPLAVLIAELTAELARARVELTREVRRREASQRALETSERQLRQIIDLAPTCISAKDEDGRYILANEALARLYHTTVDNLIGKTDADFVPSPEEAKRFRGGDLMVLERNAPIDFSEQRATTGDGEERIFHTTKIPFTTDGLGKRAVLGVSTDVTARVRAEEQLQALNEALEERVRQRTAELAAANRELEAFAYSVSHDLRSPLRGIDGWSQALLEDYGTTLDERATGYLSRVRDEIQRMGRLIDDLLSISRLSRTAMAWERVDISELVRCHVARLRERDPDRRVTVKTADATFVRGDAVLLGAVVQNLIENAWKFTSRTPDATIEFGADAAGTLTTCWVRDNGAGFDMAHAGKLFAPFQRLHTSREFPGTGVGLASVQRIIHRHGGKIWAEGAPQQGAVFRFTLENCT